MVAANAGMCDKRKQNMSIRFPILAKYNYFGNSWGEKVKLLLPLK